MRPALRFSALLSLMVSLVACGGGDGEVELPSVDTRSGAASCTATRVLIEANLRFSDSATSRDFAVLDRSSYNWSTSFSILASRAYVFTLYFRKSEVRDRWTVHVSVDGHVLSEPLTLLFSPDGTPDGSLRRIPLSIREWNETHEVELDLQDVVQFDMGTQLTGLRRVPCDSGRTGHFPAA